MTTLTGTLGAHALAATVAAGSVNTVPATGALKLSWLLIAFPLFGAVVLLVGGRRTDRWGHLLGVAMPVAAFVYGVGADFRLSKHIYVRAEYPLAVQRLTVALREARRRGFLGNGICETQFNLAPLLFHLTGGQGDG